MSRVSVEFVGVHPTTVAMHPLGKSMFTNDLTFEQTRQVLTAESLDTIKTWTFWGTPLLHEAASQDTLGAQHILETVFRDERLRPLLDDPSYVDKYGYTVVRRLSKFLGQRSSNIHKEIATAYNVSPSNFPKPVYVATSAHCWWIYDKY